jgi:putative ABC transport system ATP-binding protein
MAGDRQNTSARSPLSLVWELFNSEWNVIAVILTYEVGVGVLALTLPIGVQAVVNSIAYIQLVQPVLFLAVAVLAGQIIAAIFRIIQLQIVEKLKQRLFANLGMELSFRLPRMLKDKYLRFPELVNRFFDVITIQKSVSMIVIEGFALLLQMTIGLTLLAFYHPMLLAFDLVLILGIVFILFVLGKGAIASSIYESKCKYQVVAWLEEVAGKSVTFSARSSRYFALQQSNEVIGSYLKARDKHFEVVRRQMVGFLSLQAIANTALLVIGVLLVMANQLSVGQLVAAEIVVSGVLSSFTRFQKHLTGFYDLVAALDKISFLMEQPLEKSGQELPKTIETSGIELKEVSFVFPSLKKTLGPISLTIAPRSRIAIHGSNGSGKSTLVDILYGLRTPSSGGIIFNGLDQRLISPESLREQVGLLRGIEIVNATILDNIKIAKPFAQDSEIQAVLRSIGLLEELLTLPEGLNTILSEVGAPLSIGQLKRLMLARAIIRQPRLLLIDETLDGLDPRSKKIALDIVFDPDAAWSVLITSQHPEVEERCDQVFDLDTGTLRRVK